MAASLVQLTLLMITVIQLTSSQPPDDSISPNCCGQVLSQLTQLLSTVSQLAISNAHLTTAISLLQRDVTELKTVGRERGKLCYFGSEYNFNLNFNFKLVRRL